MSYACKTIADSVGPHGIRLTTFEITFPRPYLAELNTHRKLSRNSESSRAIPTELQIQRVRNNPYIPEFRKRVKGMGGGVFLEGAELAEATGAWMTARDTAAIHAEMMVHVAKDDANRLLEPFMWHTAIVSATDWENFLNLRDHPDAALPMQRVAKMIRENLAASNPSNLEYGEWHLPFINFRSEDPLDRAKASAGICARSSYSTHNNPESFEASKDRWEGLATRGHWSPGEHPAQCVEEFYEDVTDLDLGNFRGFKQLRKCYGNEAVFPRGR